MLTVTIKMQCGTHRTVEAKEVLANCNNSSQVHDEIVIRFADGSEEKHFYTDGEFFVMNDSGATVAKYGLRVVGETLPTGIRRGRAVEGGSLRSHPSQDPDFNRIQG